MTKMATIIPTITPIIISSVFKGRWPPLCEPVLTYVVWWEDLEDDLPDDFEDDLDEEVDFRASKKCSTIASMFAVFLELRDRSLFDVGAKVGKGESQGGGFSWILSSVTTTRDSGRAVGAGRWRVLIGNAPSWCADKADLWASRGSRLNFRYAWQEGFNAPIGAFFYFGEAWVIGKWPRRADHQLR